MVLQELKEQLVKKVVKPLYIFTGEETAILDIYINKIADLLGDPVKRVDNLKSVFDKLRGVSLMNKPSCYVIRDDQDYLKQEKVWEDLRSGKIQGNNVIILIYTNLDKRSKFYKQHSGMLTEFQKLIPEVLAKYIKKDIGLDTNLGVELAELCSWDYGRILTEEDKIQHLANARGLGIDQAFKVAVAEKLISGTGKPDPFEFIDEVCRRKRKSALRLSQEMTKGGENPLGSISLLYTNMRSMLLVRSSSNQQTKEITAQSGLTSWQVNMAREKGNNYALPELVKALRIIRETEKGIKTGTIEASMALDYILVNIL